MDHTPRSEELLMDGKHSILWRKNQSMEQISLLMKLKSIKLLFILILSLKMNKNEETKDHCFLLFSQYWLCDICCCCVLLVLECFFISNREISLSFFQGKNVDLLINTKNKKLSKNGCKKQSLKLNMRQL